MGMANLVIALVVAFGGYWLLRQFVDRAVDPGGAASRARRAAPPAWRSPGFLTLRGAAAIGAPLFVFGLGLMGFADTGFPWAKKIAGPALARHDQRSLLMELDHDTGQMRWRDPRGTVPEPHARRLSEAELQALYRHARKPPDQSRRTARSLARSQQARLAGALERLDEPGQRAKRGR